MGLNHVHCWKSLNTGASGASLSQQEKFQPSLAVPNIKYNCAVLFLCHLRMLQNIFSHRRPLQNPVRFDQYAQKQTEFTELPAGCVRPCKEVDHHHSHRAN